jgi:hypothetical protein
MPSRAETRWKTEFHLEIVKLVGVEPNFSKGVTHLLLPTAQHAGIYNWSVVVSYRYSTIRIALNGICALCTCRCGRVL